MSVLCFCVGKHGGNGAYDVDVDDDDYADCLSALRERVYIVYTCNLL